MTDRRPLEPAQEAAREHEQSPEEQFFDTTKIVEGINKLLMPLMTPENIDTFRESCVGHILISSTMGT
jgi:hypothetical protein